MRAIQLTGPRLIEVVDAPAPAPQGGQVLVRTEYLSICGSDMRQYRRVHPEEAYPFPPGVPCHEIVGVVEESRSPLVTPGQRVIALPAAGGAAGYGGGGELLVSTPDRIIPLPDGADPSTYIMCQPVGTVIFALKRLGNMLGKSAVVMGQGAIGLTFTALLNRMGAHQVIAVDRHDYRLARARTLGATVALNASDVDVAAAVADLTGGVGADVVVEACGDPASINQLALVVRRYGTIILFGLPEENVVELDYMSLVRRMATIIPTISAASDDPSGDIKEAVALVADGKLDVDWMVTHRLTMADAPRAYQMYEDYSDQVLKVVMRV